MKHKASSPSHVCYSGRLGLQMNPITSFTALLLLRVICPRSSATAANLRRWIEINHEGPQHSCLFFVPDEGFDQQWHRESLPFSMRFMTRRMAETIDESRATFTTRSRQSWSKARDPLFLHHLRCSQVSLTTLSIDHSIREPPEETGSATSRACGLHHHRTIKRRRSMAPHRRWWKRPSKVDEINNSSLQSNLWSSTWNHSRDGRPSPWLPRLP